MYGPSRFVQLGEVVSLSGRVSEYRSAFRPNDLFVTQIEVQTLQTISSGNPVSSVIISKTGDRTPPSTRLSSHDVGPDGWLSIPNNATLLERVNATLEPDKYGLDFWESLEGQLVTVLNPVAANFPDRFGAIWMYGDWNISGRNGRGGLTLTFVGMCARYSSASCASEHSFFR